MINPENPVLTPLAAKIVEAITAALSISGGVLIFIKAILPKLQRWYQLYKELSEVIKGLPMFMQTSQDVSTAVKELSTNGGTSLKDAVLRIEEATLRNEASIVQNTVATQRTEELLSRLSARHQHLWKNSPSICFYADPMGLVTETNLAFQKVVNKNEDQLLRHGWINCIQIDKRNSVWQEWDQAIKQQRMFEVETIFNNRETQHKVFIKAVPILVTGGILIGYDGLIEILE